MVKIPWCPICLRRLRFWNMTGFGSLRRCARCGSQVVEGE